MVAEELTLADAIELINNKKNNMAKHNLVIFDLMAL